MVFPKKLKGNVETLVKGLCNAIPSERLPMKKGGTQNIKSQVALRTVFHQFSSVFISFHASEPGFLDVCCRFCRGGLVHGLRLG